MGTRSKGVAPSLVAVALATALALACQGSPFREAPPAAFSSVDTPTPAPVGQPAATAVPPPSPMPAGPTVTGRPAPELQEIEGWLNSEPLTLADLRGRVVLLDFWTYTCVNCIRTFPYLREWHRKYADSGLVLIGVHTPEFDFEKLMDNVRRAAHEHDLTYPIAQDNGYTTFRAFEAQAWPTKYVIDKDGMIRYSHRGEGAYHETEQVIRELLEEAGADVSRIPADTEPPPELSPEAFADSIETSLTRELYAGFVRNIFAAGAYVINPEYYESVNADVLFTDPGRRINHFMFVQGLWHTDLESLVHARETESYEDYIGLVFFAHSVNAVMGPAEGGEAPFRVRLTMDGGPVPREAAGADVIYDEDGSSFVEVVEPRMYRLVEMREFGSHELRLSSNSRGFALYTFTFGGYREGP